MGLGTVAHTDNPRTLGGQGRWITSALELENSLANMVKFYLHEKYKNQLGMVVCAYNLSY